MTLDALARQFVELCNQGKNFDVMETMYAPTSSRSKAMAQETAGKTAVHREVAAAGGS